MPATRGINGYSVGLNVGPRGAAGSEARAVWHDRCAAVWVKRWAWTNDAINTERDHVREARLWRQAEFETKRAAWHEQEAIRIRTALRAADARAKRLSTKGGTE